PHDVGEDLPAVLARLGALDRGLGLAHEGLQAAGAQRAEELLLAAVARIQRADADAGMLGHRRDRRAGVGDEHRAGRFEDALVVAGGFGLAAAHRAMPPWPAGAARVAGAVRLARAALLVGAARPRGRLGYGKSVAGAGTNYPFLI